MKTFNTLLLTAISASPALVADAAISPEDTNQTRFDIGGVITAECKVNNLSNEAATNLDLTSASAQAASSVSVWCNTGQNSANTTYASTNNGFLVNEAGNRIAYSISLGDQGNDLSLTQPQTISQRSGVGSNGDEQVTELAINPQVSGFEYSGNYTDTITITVSYN